MSDQDLEKKKNSGLKESKDETSGAGELKDEDLNKVSGGLAACAICGKTNCGGVHTTEVL